MATLFKAEINEKQIEEVSRSVNALILLADICEICFAPEKGLDLTFFPLWLGADGRRTSVPNDYVGEQTKFFAELVPEINNPALQARLADIAWQNDRPLTEMAKYAVSAYTRSVSEVLKGNFTFWRFDSNPSSNLGCDYLLRALQISNAPGSRVPEQEISELKKLISEIAKYSHENRVYPGYTLLPRMCLDYSIGSPVSIAKDAEEMAKDQSMSVWDRQDLWKLAAAAYQKGKFKDERNRCLIAAAECYVEKSLVKVELKLPTT